MDLIVTHKKKINGHVLGVNFVDGEAVNPHPAALAYFQENDDYSVAEKKATLDKTDQKTDATA